VKEELQAGEGEDGDSDKEGQIMAVPHVNVTLR
jgi:hypothetical protein